MKQTKKQTFCSNCSLKCIASDCECVCHTQNNAFNYGIQQGKELIEKKFNKFGYHIVKLNDGEEVIAVDEKKSHEMAQDFDKTWEQAKQEGKQELWDDIKDYIGAEFEYWYPEKKKEIKKRHNLK